MTRIESIEYTATGWLVTLYDGRTLHLTGDDAPETGMYLTITDGGKAAIWPDPYVGREWTVG